MAPIYNALEAWGAAELPGASLLSLIILFILTITLLALCTRCQKHSFDLEHNFPGEGNSTLVRVIQMEDIPMAVNNPTTDDITKDEKCDGIFINGTKSSPTVPKPSGLESRPRSVHQTAPPHAGSSEDEIRGTNHDLSHTVTQTYNTTSHTYDTIGVRNGPEVSVSAHEKESPLNPYSMYESIMTNGSQRNGTNALAQATLAEELDEDLDGGNVSDMYARVSKKIRYSSPPLELTLENDEEDGASSLPEGC